MLSIAEKVIRAGTGDAHLDVAEQRIYHQFRALIQYTTRDLRYTLNNHHHMDLSIVEGKEYLAKVKEKKAAVNDRA